MSQEYVLVRLHPAAAPAHFVTTTYVGKLEKSDDPEKVVMSDVANIYEALSQNKQGQMNVQEVVHTSNYQTTGSLSLDKKHTLWIKPVAADDPVLKLYFQMVDEVRLKKSGLETPNIITPGGRR